MIIAHRDVREVFMAKSSLMSTNEPPKQTVPGIEGGFPGMLPVACIE
jgi:hypothetical protein